MICEIKNLSLCKSIKTSIRADDEVAILSNVNIALKSKSIHVIIGESGSGKTSLLKCIAGFDTGFTGSITFNESLINSKQNIQMLFQNDGELLNPVRIVQSLLEDVLSTSEINKHKLDIIESLLNKFNLHADVLQRRGYELSGGTSQRIALMRILLTEPKLILLDEPFASQDTESNEIILNNLLRVNSENGTTILCVTHNLNLISKFADEISVLHNGEIIESGSTKEILTNPKEEFSKSLLSAML